MSERKSEPPKPTGQAHVPIARGVSPPRTPKPAPSRPSKPEQPANHQIFPAQPLESNPFDLGDSPALPTNRYQARNSSSSGYLGFALGLAFASALFLVGGLLLRQKLAPPDEKIATKVAPPKAIAKESPKPAITQPKPAIAVAALPPKKESNLTPPPAVPEKAEAKAETKPRAKDEMPAEEMKPTPAGEAKAEMAKPPTTAPEPKEPAAASTPTVVTKLTFAKDILPIMKSRCENCHGFMNKKKGGLDVRTLQAIFAGGDSGPAVVKGEPEKSPLADRIADGSMPPAGKKVSDEELAKIREWIAGGAK